MGEASETELGTALSLSERSFDSSEFSAENTLISAFMVTHGGRGGEGGETEGKREKKREREIRVYVCLVNSKTGPAFPSDLNLLPLLTDDKNDDDIRLMGVLVPIALRSVQNATRPDTL